MCGIIGSISNRVNRNTFENSMKFMTKRGPDNSGISIFNINQHLVHLGHQRLSIIDLSENGKQPFFSVDKKFAIIGDQGINELVAPDFWDTTKEIVIAHFKNGNFKTGLVEGILSAGNQLKAYFPYQSDDEDELSNEISKSE